jgi:hypothetical protein
MIRVFTRRYGAVFQKEHTRAQTVSRQSFTTEAQIQSQPRACGICDEKIDTGTFFPGYVGLPLSVSFPQLFIFVDSYDLVG